jgi:hypothetical protein
MADLVSVKDVAQAADPAPQLCWICNRNQANSGEHKTKRSDLLTVLGNPTQEAPFFYSDLKKTNRPVKSLKAHILKSPVRICADCNTTRTQPHDRAWERMSDRLRGRCLKVGEWVRANSIFPHYTRTEMTNVQLFFVKLFGCMLCEAKANGYNVPIDIVPFSEAIMSGCPHPEVYLQFGKHDGSVGRTNLECWTTEQGSILAGWLYELKTIAVSVMFAQAGRWQPSPNTWHPLSGSKRFRIVDFQYNKRAARDGVPKEEAVPQPYP